MTSSRKLNTRQGILKVKIDAQTGGNFRVCNAVLDTAAARGAVRKGSPFLLKRNSKAEKKARKALFFNEDASRSIRSNLARQARIYQIVSRPKTTHRGRPRHSRNTHRQIQNELASDNCQGRNSSRGNRHPTRRRHSPASQNRRDSVACSERKKKKFV